MNSSAWARVERSLADARVEQAERKTAKQAEPSAPTKADFHPARRQLYEAVKTLRALGWSDGDIVFGAELNPEQPTSFIDLASPEKGADR